MWSTNLHVKICRWGEKEKEPNFVTIRQFEQKNDSKNFAGGGEKEKEPQKGYFPFSPKISNFPFSQLNA